MRPQFLALAPLLLLACSCQKVPPLTGVASQELACDQDMTVERAGAAGDIYRASGRGGETFYRGECEGNTCGSRLTTDPRAKRSQP